VKAALFVLLRSKLPSFQVSRSLKAISFSASFDSKDVSAVGIRQQADRMARNRTASSGSGSGNGSSGSPSSGSEDGQDFLDQLSRKQVLEISAAFDKAAAGIGVVDQLPASKRRKIDVKGKGKAVVEHEAGGFLLEGEDDDGSAKGGGGFIPEDEPIAAAAASSSAKKIKNTPAVSAAAKSVLLDDIPSILESLNLDGDDTSILSIFENASETNRDGLAIVKRKKFLRVAAILITQRDEDDNAAMLSRQPPASASKVHSGGGKGRAVRMDIDEEADEHDDSDPLVLSSDEEEEDEDPQAGEDSDPWADEDDLEGAFSAAVGAGRDTSPPSTRRTTRSRAGEAKSVPTSASPEPGTSTTKAAKGKGKATASSGKKAAGKATTKDIKLSADQKEECEKMFQQFFSSNDKSKNRAITMADIRYVATLLNEKISDADVSCCFFLP
jgi:hypothetical protein